jgi:hypothetical protein
MRQAQEKGAGKYPIFPSGNHLNPSWKVAAIP